MADPTPENPAVPASLSVGSLQPDPLGNQKTEQEIEKLKVEVEELKAWRWKVVLATLTPIGSVFLFLWAWHGSHLNERRQQSQVLYARAAQDLASSEASVRLSGVKTIETYIEVSRPGFFGTISQWAFTNTNAQDLEEQRKQESMALIVGLLSHEKDAAVLAGISDEVRKNPEEAIDPIVSVNKAAAVRFARAAGRYAGLSVLRMQKSSSFSEDVWKEISNGRSRDDDPTVQDIQVITLRTGSPFEGTDTYNQRFLAGDFLTNNRSCPFRSLFENEQNLVMGSGFHDVTRTKPPKPKEIEAAVGDLVDSAAILERSSFILEELVRDKWAEIDSWHKTKHKNLFGTAVVVGNPGGQAIANLRSLGGYYNDPMNNLQNPGCTVPGN
jgi:hypothetical protein